MKADRDCFEPAMRSMAANTSPESVIDVFSFILLIYYHLFHTNKPCHPEAKRSGVEGPCVFIGLAYHVERTLLSAAFDLADGGVTCPGKLSRRYRAPTRILRHTEKNRGRW